MTAPKTKKNEDIKKDLGVQLIVFAPVNADPDDENQRIYMVCPTAMRVVEIVEKHGSDAEDYLMKLTRTKIKSKLPPNTFIDELGNSVEDDDGGIISEDDVDALVDVDIEGINAEAVEKLELDSDLVAFASGAMGDIFPEDGSEGSNVTDIDMSDALDLLDEEDDEDEIRDLVNNMSGDDGLDALPAL